MNEKDLVQRLKDRDQSALEELLRHFGPLMRYIIAPILPGEQDREECLSETVLTVWEKIGTYDPDKGGWTTWLTAVTRNRALNRARQLRREDTQELTPDIPSPEPTPEERVIQKEREAALMEALRYLGDRERMLFYRKYYYRQSTAQMAAELGMTERAVEGKLYRIKQKLRKRLGGDGYA
ncbi:MAG: sigma-70 family RNA polymerase sigma factor [Ruminiclostridium sp.]|nr:sigma-70 family RNA polymerase sigma factor [Ruminiclostridium sp.]